MAVVTLLAMGFNYTNGFHDAANAIATSVSTRALTPRAALAMAAVANLFGATKANILNLQLVNREGPFHTDIIDLEVADAQHLMRILSALRAIDVVVQADRV